MQIRFFLLFQYFKGTRLYIFIGQGLKNTIGANYEKLMGRVEVKCKNMWFVGYHVGISAELLYFRLRIPQTSRNHQPSRVYFSVFGEMFKLLKHLHFTILFGLVEFTALKYNSSCLCLFIRHMLLRKLKNVFILA